MNEYLGVDIGGTKIASAIVDNSGHLHSRVEVPSLKKDSNTLFYQVTQCIEETLKKEKTSIKELGGIGLGVPGKVDPEEGIALFQNNLPWVDFPLANYIKRYFGVNNVVIDNDVHMAGLAEWILRGENYNETFVYMTISTGISCCILNKGHFIRGSGLAGEIGFLPVFSNNFKRFNRLEELASGQGIEKMVNKNDALTHISTKQVIEGYINKRTQSLEVMDEVFSAYAQGIYTLECLLDPDKIVFGGGVINHNPNLLNEIKKYLKKHLVKEQFELLERLYISDTRENAGLMGAGLACSMAFTKK